MKRLLKLFVGKLLLITLFFQVPVDTSAQNDVMMQAFYWDVPVDMVTNNGTWWDNLSNKAVAMKNAGITGIWVPSPAKGNFGIIDMGYGIFDHYDLGDYNQKGTTETRFGSRAELESMISAMHTNGIEVYADMVLNHLYTNESESEANPAVKQYVFDEAYRSSTQYQPYPTNEITWVIPNATAGDYYIQIKGYMLNWTVFGERGYDIHIDWTGSGSTGTPSWEFEPNNGGGNFNAFPASGHTVQAHINSQADIDEYKITLSSASDIIIKLTAKKEGVDSNQSWEWQWAAQQNGYYPVAVWHNGSNLASTTLQAKTNTGVQYVTHTGAGEPNYSWNYTHFHPADNNDWLGFYGSDEIITNTKFFGNDFNTFDPIVQNRFKDWGAWLVNQIGFDGFRLDFVRGFQESYAADWVNSLPLKNGAQRFIVGEYWGADYRIKNWVNAVAAGGADVDGFDFPLKNTLKDMSNGNQSSFNMAWLNHSGLVRNNAGNSLPGTSVVTFVENHDTGKESDKWLTKDFDMAYAYMLTHEGRPVIFYPHYYGVTQIDNHDPSKTVTAPSSLQEDINKLMFTRKTYLGGTLAVLSQVGNPHPSGDTYHVYAARRQGNGSKNGAIIVINNNDSNTKGLWVDSSPTGYQDWANETLVNAFNPAETIVVQSDGRVYVSAPARGYAIWVKNSEYVAYTTPAARSGNSNTDTGKKKEALNSNSLIKEADLNYNVNQNYPNPFSKHTNISFTIPEEGNVEVIIYNTLGQEEVTLVKNRLSAGEHTFTWNNKDKRSGIYYYTVKFKNKAISKRMLKIE